jgi:hypothetical protein
VEPARTEYESVALTAELRVRLSEPACFTHWSKHQRVLPASANAVDAGDIDRRGYPQRKLGGGVNQDLFMRSAPTNEKAIMQLFDDRLCQAWRVPF